MAKSSSFSHLYSPNFTPLTFCWYIKFVATPSVLGVFKKNMVNNCQILRVAKTDVNVKWLVEHLLFTFSRIMPWTEYFFAEE